MHFAPSALQCVCLNTPLLPKHGVFKECHTQTLQLNHRLDARTGSVASLSDATYPHELLATLAAPFASNRYKRFNSQMMFMIGTKSTIC